MKQGTLINRIVMLLLLAAVLVYLGVSAWRSFRDPYTLVLSYAYTVDDSLEATGFLVREERVLASPGGIVDLLPEEGEKVSRGETVALLYQNDSGLARKEELQSLTMEKEQLQYALERTQSGGDSSQLSQQVIDAIVALRSSVSTGDLTRLEDETLLLKSLVYKRDFTFNGGEEDGDAAAAIQSSIDAVDAQIAALSAQAAQDTSRLTASQAGVFSGQTDGYESLLTPGLLETITPGQLSQLDRQRPQPDAGAVGKLVTDATWYFVCAMGEEEAGRLIEGRTVTVRFSRDWSGEVDMKVERVGETPENGRVAVVLSSDRYLSETTLLRKQTVELVFDSQTGIRVPTQSVRVEERTVTDPETEEEKQELVTGVYVLVGQQAEFKPVTILAQLEDFALVSGGDSSQLSQQVIDAIVALRSSVSTGDLTRLEDETLLLKSLVYKRDFTFNGGEEDGDAAAAIQSSIDAVDAQIAALSAQAAQDTSRLTASQAGVFSGQTDGYESLLTPGLLETITPGQLSQLDRQRPQPDAGAVGKLVTDATWYFVCAMGEEEAGRLIEGRTVTVRFSRDWSGEVDMKVERVGETPENGRVAVVLSSDRYLSETTLLRKQTVELVFDSQTGIRVPTQSVRVEERTVTDPETEEEKQELVTGVYVLVGQQAEFKPVTILAQLEDFALVKSADGSDGKKALRAGDEVILSSVELFDGKVITQS